MRSANRREKRLMRSARPRRKSANSNLNKNERPISIKTQIISSSTSVKTSSPIARD